MFFSPVHWKTSISQCSSCQLQDNRPSARSQRKVAFTQCLNQLHLICCLPLNRQPGWSSKKESPAVLTSRKCLFCKLRSLIQNVPRPNYQGPPNMDFKPKPSFKSSRIWKEKTVSPLSLIAAKVWRMQAGRVRTEWERWRVKGRRKKKRGGGRQRERGITPRWQSCFQDSQL